MRCKALGVLLYCLVVLSGLLVPVIAEDKPYSQYGGGVVYGQILGFNRYNELIPIVWADVSGWQDGELINIAYSMSGGYYELILPVGWYELVVEEPGYETYSREIFVSSGSATAINVVLNLSGKPIHEPKPKPPPEPAQYTVQITVSGLPSDLKTQLNVDGTLREEITDGEKTELTFNLDSTHTVSVEELIERNGEHYVVDEGSITVSEATIHEFKYRTEYLLEFVSEPEGLSLPFQLQTGWYPAGETISTPKAPTLIEESSRIRYRFTTWMLNNDKAQGNPIDIVMDKPITLKVVYSAEYLVEVSSVYGRPEGSGWYPEGSTATISIQPSEGLLIRRVFIGWSGDYTGKDPTSTVTVNNPMQIIAVWTIDYTPLIIIITIATIVVAVASIAVFLSRRRESPSR